MNAKIAKEIRKAVLEQFPHLGQPGNEKAFKKACKAVKRSYKSTPHNQKNEVVVK